MIRMSSAVAALAVATTLAVAGCGGGSSSAESGGYGSAQGTDAKQGSEGPSAGYAYGTGATVASRSAAATISASKVGDVGKVLVDSKGLTLYYFEKDRGGRSACYGACAAAWPPLTTTGTPRARGGVMRAKLGTTRRKGGKVQVTYAGRPLYAYAGDARPREDNGTDLKSFGAAWYPLHPNGKKAGH